MSMLLKIFFRHMPNGELVELASEKNMANMWQQATSNNYHITLWVYAAS